MNQEQEEFLNWILTELLVETDDKFRKGQVEHGGNLWEMPEHDLLDNAIMEAIDQCVYLLTLKYKLTHKG